LLEAWQKLPAGTHSFAVEVPPGVSGNVEASVENSPVGAVARVMVKGVNGTVLEERETLERPLGPNEGFAAHVELDDWAEALRYGEGAGRGKQAAR
jgi:hypothetical protein